MKCILLGTTKRILIGQGMLNIDEVERDLIIYSGCKPVILCGHESAGLRLDDRLTTVETVEVLIFRKRDASMQ